MNHRPAAPGLKPRPIWRSAAVALIAVVFLVAASAIVAMPSSAGGTAVNLSAGESATQEILAPAPLSYVSEVLTERARDEAARTVLEVYDAPDARVARQQVILLRDILDFVNSTRADTLATGSQKRADLEAIRDTPLDAGEIAVILSLDDVEWAGVRSEALTVLEQLMRSQVRQDQVDGIRRLIPARVSVNLSETQAQVVAALVSPMIAPNSFYNEVATEAARQAARQAVAPVERIIVRGQAIVVRGQVVTEADLEALAALGLLRPEGDWQSPASAFLAVLMSGAVLAVYVQRFNPEFVRRPRRTVLLCLLFTTFLLAAKLMVPGRTVMPFLFPAAALSMLLTVVAGPHLGIVVSVGLAALVGYIDNSRLELTVYTGIGSIVAALALGRAERINQFFRAGLVVALANAGVVLAFRLTDPALDTLGLMQLLAASLVNGAVSASVAVAGLFILGELFDVTTSLQLIELARPDHPLLRFILRNAPGTYQHSLQVANLAEQAAERIGANAMLTRVGALYHDAGKALQPHYYVENQLNGANIHETLDPVTSADIIIGHVHDGIRMARRHRLPSHIRAFIAEHHGTLKTIYQYQRAVEAADGHAGRIDGSRFTYPGPRPQSKETALLMLADGCEARLRSERPQSEEDIDRLVKAVIEDRLAKGQLDDTSLTLHDLRLIRESFVYTLKGVFHPRLQYPEEKPVESGQPVV